MKQFPPQSAARVLTRNIPTASAKETVAEVLENIKKKAHTFDTISYTYILSQTERLCGVVAIKSLLKAQNHQQMKEIMTPNPVAVHPYTDQEKAAILAIQENIKAVPVTDKDYKFQGIIPTDRILDILHQEHIEDILKLSGLDVSTLQLAEAKRHISSAIRMRLPWLIIGLAGGIVASWIVSLFNETIRSNLSLVFFIPVVVYLSGAIASQTNSLLIRNLLLSKLSLKKYLLREVVVGSLLGIVFAAILGAISWVWIGSSAITTIITTTMILNAVLVTLIATIIPFTLVKLNKDPALAAGPFAIVIQDILSLVVYFTTALIVLT